MSVSGQHAAGWLGRAIRPLTVCLSLWAAAFSAQAVTVPDLYSVDVPVEGTSTGDLAAGYAEGLRRVLVRVSGSRDVLANEGIDGLLGNAESLLLSYQVVRGDDGQDRLKMSFGAVGVNQALASVNAPVWGANRPLTLAWVAVEDGGSRHLVTGAPGGADPAGNTGAPVTSAASWRQALQSAARVRGLPVAFPPAAMSEDRNLSSEIWGQFADRLRTVDGAPEHDAMALVRVSRSGGQWRAGWVFDGMSMNDGESTVTADSRDGLAQALIDRWADRYAQRYAVAAGDVGDLPKVDIVIDGVQSVADYGKAVSLLDALTPVKSVGASRVHGNTLTLQVAFSGELEQLKRYMALDNRFVPQEAPAAEPAPVPSAPEGTGTGDDSAFGSLYPVLHYRWQAAPMVTAGPAADDAGDARQAQP